MSSPHLEVSRLSALETVIETGRQTFVEVGLALLEIRDSRLYKREYGTFEDYCRERWGWSRQRGYQLINAAEMSTTVDNTVQNEWQARQVRSPEREGSTPEVTTRQPTRLDVHFSSTTDDWATPQDLFDELNAEFNFTLDVCASPDNAKCQRFFTHETNGLAQHWTGSCWMNPPYGDVIGQWVEKAHGSAVEDTVVVCLVPARTDTAWWWDHARFGEVRFLRGRLKFGGAENSAPFPSAVVIFGGEACVKWWER